MAEGGLHLFVVAEVRLVGFVHYDRLLVEQLGVVFCAWKLLKKCDMIFYFWLSVHDVSRLADIRELSFPMVVVMPNLVCVWGHLLLFSHVLNRPALFLLLLLEWVFTAWRQVGVVSPFWMTSLPRRRTAAWWGTVGHWDSLTSIVLPLLMMLVVHFNIDFFIA